MPDTFCPFRRFTLREWRFVCTVMMIAAVFTLNPILFLVAWFLRPSKAAVAESETF